MDRRPCDPALERTARAAAILARRSTLTLRHRGALQRAPRSEPPAREDSTAIVAAIQEAGRGRDLVGIYAAGGIHSGFANSFGQRNWFSSYSYNFDWSFYHQGDKAVKCGYAGFVWDPAEFTRKVECCGRATGCAHSISTDHRAWTLSCLSGA